MAKTERKRPITSSKRLTGDIAKAVRAALDKKALDVVVLDLRKTHAFTDFFLLCSGQNTRQVHAIADSVEETLRAVKIKPANVEGYKRGEWVLMDYFTFIVRLHAADATSTPRRRGETPSGSRCRTSLLLAPSSRALPKGR